MVRLPLMGGGGNEGLQPLRDLDNIRSFLSGMGMGAFFVVLALVFGIWLLVPGLGLVVWALLGGTAEGRRGGHH